MKQELDSMILMGLSKVSSFYQCQQMCPISALGCEVSVFVCFVCRRSSAERGQAVPLVPVCTAECVQCWGCTAPTLVKGSAMLHDFLFFLRRRNAALMLS